MELLEREPELQILNTTLQRVLGGEGAVIALLGEAGIGKSSLAREFLVRARPEMRVLRGSCDDLGIAEPLGVLRDLARETNFELPEDLVEPGARLRAFSTMFENISNRALPTVVFVEDVHWADDATVDFLRFLTRRISETHIMLLLTARSDETKGQSNVRRIMGDAVSQDVKRLHLGPLSEATVTRLAKEAGLDAEMLIRVTAGNAFFVTELVESGDETYSATVRDAVLARADRLNPKIRSVLNAAAVFPRHADVTLLAQILERDDVDEALEACVDQGLLVSEGRTYAFRHVLSRLAVLSGISASTKRTLNDRALERLLADGEATLSRLLYHAREAGNDDAVRRFSSEAAEEALRLGAHREAREYFRVAVDARGGEASAELLEKAAYASYLVGVDSDAVEFQNRALAIYENDGDRLRYGNGLRLRSRYYWSAGAFEPSRQDAEAAVKDLSGFRSAELAMAYSNAAQVHMLNRKYRSVREPAEAAIELAGELEKPDILSHALNNLACALQYTDPDRARRDMDRSLKIALEIGQVDHAARAFVNATYVEMYLGQFDAAKAFATRGIFYCKTHELDGSLVYLTGALGLAELGLGELEAAGRSARAAISRANNFDVGLYRHSGSIALLRYQVRTGVPLDPDEIAYLDSFRSDGSEIQRLIPYAECIAEQAWMTGEDLENSIDLLEAAIEWAPAPEIAQSAYVWLRRLDAGHASPDFDGFLACNRFELKGDIEAADVDWAARAAPYERALCLAQGDRKSRQRAAELFDSLGAVMAARRVRAAVNRVGAQPASKPRASTLSNPSGLTRRQMDVLLCLQDGLSNADIAERLFISPKTVDHHVSAILAKLGARTRAEAAIKTKNWDLKT